MPPINKDHARKIAHKLGAEIDQSPKAHDVANIVHNAQIIASFGIRRGSRKSLGHGHISNDLHLSPHDTIRLANCPMSREEWIQRLREEGLIPEEEVEE